MFFFSGSKQNILILVITIGHSLINESTIKTKVLFFKLHNRHSTKQTRWLVFTNTDTLVFKGRTHVGEALRTYAPLNILS